MLKWFGLISVTVTLVIRSLGAWAYRMGHGYEKGGARVWGKVPLSLVGGNKRPDDTGLLIGVFAVLLDGF